MLRYPSANPIIPMMEAIKEEKMINLGIFDTIWGDIIHFRIMKIITRYAVLIIWVITIESKPECHPENIIANSHPSTKRSSLLIQNFFLQMIILMTAKGERTRKTISGTPILSLMNLNPID